MKIFNYIIISILLININCFGQKKNIAFQPANNSLFSIKDSLRISRISQLKLPESYKSKSLPAVVDNSELVYFRPLFEQLQNECGQASGIGMNFTYEIDFYRNLPATIEQNQYPTYYCWNFENGGNGWYGVSYLHSFEIVKTNGIANVVDYGGMAAGGHERWLSGYQEYYNGMHNRIKDYYAIKVGTPDKLLTLKHWLNDHFDGSEYGGVASIYSDSGWDTHLLPLGTPEEGKHVIIGWSDIVGHALTICGYNDSIRYDYNGDGIFTNDVDINEDGTINMKDWEIGGLKYANNFWQGTCYADSGFCYVMYKTLADEFGNGGLWNNEVHVVKPKEDYNPLLTARVIIKHDSRNKVKILMGISGDTNDVEPYAILDFPIFDFQGGNQYMQGGNSIEENKTIEIGLDITPLLNDINTGQFAKVFLQLLENDPDNIGTGEIIHFSIIDYSNGINEIYCNNSNIPIVENGTTTLSLMHLFDFYEINIDTDELPSATLYQPYNFQLNVSGGSTPYFWNLIMNYTESNYSDVFVEFDDEELIPDDPQNGFVSKQLDFSFPVYGQYFDEVNISTDGFIFFDQNLYPWPYLHDELLYLKNLKLISPFLCEDIEINSNNYDGIWYKSEGNSASFRWKASFTDQPNDYYINVALRLFSSGEIEVKYGDITLPENQKWISGISNGDLNNYQLTSVSNQQNPQDNFVIKFLPQQIVHEIEITDDGIFQGVPISVYNPGEISVRVFDNNNISAVKTFEFITNGVLMEYTVDAGGDQIIEASENVKLSFAIQNTDSQNITNAFFKLSSSSPYISITDSTEYIGLLIPGEIILLTDVFEFHVSENIANNYLIQLVSTIDATEGSWDRSFDLTGYSAVVNLLDYYISDGGNCSLSSNETVDLIVEIQNIGMAKTNDIEIEINSDDPYIILNNNTTSSSLLLVDSIWPATLNISTVEFVPFEYLADIDYYISMSNGSPVSGTIPVKINFNVEDFESNGTELFPWINTSPNPWYIDNEIVLGGNYSLKSGNIENNQSTILIINLDVLIDGEISFYKKISCEDSQLNDTDYLRFFINSNEVARWDGQIDWSHEHFDVEEGMNMFIWIYSKNQDISSNSDCVWLDNIIFPSVGNIVGSEKNFAKNNEILSVYPNPFKDIVTINFVAEKSGNFMLYIYDITGKKVKTVLFNEYLYQGNHLYTWDGNNNAGISMNDGLYYCILQSSEIFYTRKLVKIKQ